MSASAEFLIFDVAGVELCLPLNKVEEVIPATRATPLPKSPPFLCGLAAVRGRVFAVIDAAKRYGVGPALSSFYLICKVRENLTAVAIDRPVNAGKMHYRDLTPEERSVVTEKSKIPAKFIDGAIEILAEGESGETTPSGRFVQIINPDLFVSDEMASRLSEG